MTVFFVLWEQIDLLIYLLTSLLIPTETTVYGSDCVKAAFSLVISRIVSDWQRTTTRFSVGMRLDLFGVRSSSFSPAKQQLVQMSVLSEPLSESGQTEEF